MVHWESSEVFLERSKADVLSLLLTCYGNKIIVIELSGGIHQSPCLDISTSEQMKAADPLAVAHG